jgi:hypothetical protein
MKKLTRTGYLHCRCPSKGLGREASIEREREKNQGDIFVWVVVVVSGSRQIDKILCWVSGTVLGGGDMINKHRQRSAPFPS